MEKKLVLVTAFVAVLLFSAVVGAQFVNLVYANWMPHPEPEHNIEITCFNCRIKN